MNRLSITKSADCKSTSSKELPVVPRELLVSFALLTSCFALWGLAHNMTDVLVAQFRKVFILTDIQSSMVQMAFYGAYFCLALPAAIYIKKFSYKSGVLLGLGLFAFGALLFYPASQSMQYSHFLAALFILAGGLSILETSANPYVIAMGPEETATQRLNLAQSFNPFGSIIGVLIGKFYILSQLNPATEAQRALMPVEQLRAIQSQELMAVMGPYIMTAVVIMGVWLSIALRKMPKAVAASEAYSYLASFRRLFKRKVFIRGVLGQFLYMGAQVGCWSWTIRYVMKNVGGTEAEASTYYLYSILLFSGGRFVCTSLMRYIKPAKLLGGLAIVAAMMAIVVMLSDGYAGIYALVVISGCMSLMFPTIYGISVSGLGNDTQLGGSCLIMAILGGAVLTALMGWISDRSGIGWAFVVPLVGFIYLTWFGLKGSKKKEISMMK
ncbi:L-fucose:H+ symporter permease [Endozoicomonas sp. 4G]|uniref:L-fucose:H+ symporter permease n=1 Tax=Endozoicomonas sp. 4G TaxID=2872754 RepID=UPI0020785E8B|nr:L-fucose:H+ symporter permease [Endozoicomonas sp. 4G]